MSTQAKLLKDVPVIDIGADILPIRGTVIPQSSGEGIHKVIHCDRSDRPSFYNLDYTVDLTPRKEVVAA